MPDAKLGREHIQKYVGNMSQIAGIRSYTFNSGREKGCEAFEINTGAGLCYTVLPDRGMDLYFADYRGTNLVYITKSGVASSQYYHPQGKEWLRSFGGGLLTTCGLTHVGNARKTTDWDRGMHGRISNTPAYDICSQAEWRDGDYMMTVEGKMREAVLYEENLVMKRTIVSKAGEAVISIQDEIENQGTERALFMMVYHMNFGYPLLSEHCILDIPSKGVEPYNAEAVRHLEHWNRGELPRRGETDQLFFHQVEGDMQGNARVVLRNADVGIGVAIQYKPEQLPYLTQWKHMGLQDYVMAIEPGNCLPVEWETNEKRQSLRYLEPGEKCVTQLQIEAFAL